MPHALRPPPPPAPRPPLRLPLGLAAALLASATLAPAQTTSGQQPDARRWDATIADFAKADQARRPAAGGVLFVGSSSIRLWQHLPEDFRQAPLVINRGFGGSTMADVRHYARQLVIQYQPRQVLVYAGDNDLAEGRRPADVLEDFRAFVETVRSELPGVRISYISVKPSPLRLQLLPRVRETNTLLGDYVNTLPNASFIDVFTPMVDGQGLPRADLYGPDRLHMNAAGYALWRQVIASHVAVADNPPAGTNTAAPSLPPSR
ncbi:MAG TPA: SGNH/GDSL hydrolase family protein [Ramlibacter sp.]|jgi:lysophospholipase L1-like esterase|uniref:SGNH/GDSL hydrolase family protein n=1 Tax=Ramlibacter sp. TaxID=1917967 RepID=UPI002D6AC013|nr:SGNH/GDSL hydrolase family protein [Ramlibacter sp.]HZY20294.1 SGNH/GDSL hydrolase family protein [Ramlibacter sp.]